MSDDESGFDDLAAKVTDLRLNAGLNTPSDLDSFQEGSASHSLLHCIAKELVKCYAALEPLRAIPPLPSPLSLDALAAYCRTLGYPYSSTSALLLIDFLAAELQAARLTLAARREERASRTAAPVTLDGELYLLVKALAIPSVTDDALRNAAERVVAQIKAKVAVLLGKLPLNFFDMHVPLMDQKLATPAVLDALSEVNAMLREDYTLRREMLIKRLDVTVQSFLWSARAGGREAEINGTIAGRRRALATAPVDIAPADAFTAGVELSQLLSQRVTDSSTRALRHATVKSVIIGRVPDRGGRVGEHKLSAGPSWQSRKDGGVGGGRGGKRERGGNGGGGSSAAAAAAGSEKTEADAAAAASSPSDGGAAAAAGGGGCGSDKSRRAREMLAEARLVEGEAGAGADDLDAAEAAGELDGIDDDDDGVVDGTAAGGGADAAAGGGSSRGRGRGGGGRGGGRRRRGGRGGRGGGGRGGGGGGGGGGRPSDT